MPSDYFVTNLPVGAPISALAGENIGAITTYSAAPHEYETFPGAQDDTYKDLLRDGWFPRRFLVLPDALPVGWALGDDTPWPTGFKLGQYAQFYRFADWTLTYGTVSFTVTAFGTPTKFTEVMQNPPAGMSGSSADGNYYFYLGLASGGILNPGGSPVVNGAGTYLHEGLIYPAISAIFQYSDPSGGGGSFYQTAGQLPGYPAASRVMIHGAAVQLHATGGGAAPSGDILITPNTALRY